jgi:hypothetical protein
MLRVNLLFLTAVLLVISCKTQPVSKNSHLEVLDSLKASDYIVLEDTDIYFDRLQPLEVSIQMNRATPFEDKAQAVDSLKLFLKSQVLDFSKEDKVFIESVFNEAKKRIAALNPGLMPDTIRIIKIKPDPFGDRVYFTRLNTIYFPKSTFEAKNFEIELKVMVHEIWHIISRLNPQLRDKTYPLIGFEKHGRDLKFPESLTKKMIINPDASYNTYGIDLDGTLAIPLLTSKHSAYTKEIPFFFDYIDFNLYPVNADNSVGTRGILDQRTDIFFQKIKDNTNYIIHPEEIIAENFQLLVYANYDNKYEGFSSEGKELLMKLKEVLIK